MRIQHNIAALNSHRQLTNNNNSVSKNLEKLSSGYRINRAGDDAAGLAISEKMRAQITGLETAQKNANDGISLVQTAEGALTEVHSMLNRMVELADQSANGTYDNVTDRTNLQKEVQSLKEEINRISEGTNFNGINLLDGSVNQAYGIDAGGLSGTEIGAVKSGAIGTLGTNVDGDLTKGTKGADYSAKFYVGDITNNNAATKDITFNYKDNAGASKAVTLTVGIGESITTEDIVNALTGNPPSSITAADSGTAFDGSGTNGDFGDLYDVSFEGNIITITAKADKTSSDPDEIVDGSQLGGITVGNDFDTDDVDASIEAMEQKYDGATNAAIGYGSAAGNATAYEAAVGDVYQVASTKLTMTGTGADNHNRGITVGDKTYVIQSGNEEVKGVPDDAVIVKVAATATAADIATKLAATISAQEGTNGNYVATNAAGVLTISESTNRAQDVLDGDAAVGTASSVASLKTFTTTPGTTQTNGDLTLDVSKITNGSTITVGEKVYMLTSDDTVKAKNGATKVSFASDATDSEVAQALADAMAADGITGVTAGDGKITFASTEGKVSAEGAGLTLQIGDTSDSFNQMSVKINSTSTAALGIDGIDISSQSGATAAIDSIKAAINSVSSNRGDLGAIQNRLEHTINNLGVTAENMTAAESRIRDVDMAEEMMAYTKNNILVQASQAMLAQANQLPQGVLQLLQ